jgi:hypothetical protein
LEFAIPLKACSAGSFLPTAALFAASISFCFAGWHPSPELPEPTLSFFDLAGRPALASAPRITPGRRAHFVFQVDLVIVVEDAVRGELEAIARRDGLKSK